MRISREVLLSTEGGFKGWRGAIGTWDPHSGKRQLGRVHLPGVGLQGRDWVSSDRVAPDFVRWAGRRRVPSWGPRREVRRWHRSLRYSRGLRQPRAWEKPTQRDGSCGQSFSAQLSGRQRVDRRVSRVGSADKPEVDSIGGLRVPRHRAGWLEVAGGGVRRHPEVKRPQEQLDSRRRWNGEGGRESPGAVDSWRGVTGGSHGVVLTRGRGRPPKRKRSKLNYPPRLRKLVDPLRRKPRRARPPRPEVASDIWLRSEGVAGDTDKAFRSVEGSREASVRNWIPEPDEDGSYNRFKGYTYAVGGLSGRPTTRVARSQSRP